MRYDTPVFFRKVTSGAYDSDTGNYGEPEIAETTRYASVTDSGAETLRLVYGELRQGSLVVRLQCHYADPFDFVRIGEKVYKADFVRNFRAGQVFVVSEVQ